MKRVHHLQKLVIAMLILAVFSLFLTIAGYSMNNDNMNRINEEKREELDIFAQSEIDNLIEKQNPFMNDNAVFYAFEASVSSLIPAGILNHDEVEEIITNDDLIKFMINSLHEASRFVAEYRYRKAAA